MMRRGSLLIVMLFAGIGGVEIFPNFQDVLTTENADSVTLPCIYRSKENHLSGVNFIQWTLNDRDGPTILSVDSVGQQMSERQFARRVTLGDSASLVLTSPTISDSAIYVCTVNIPADTLPLAIASVELVVRECDEPDTVAVGICLALDILVILATTACIWFLQNAQIVLLVLCFLRVLAAASVVSSALSITLLAVYVSNDCVGGILGLYPAGIVFCMIGLVMGIISWFITVKMHRGEKKRPFPRLSKNHPADYTTGAEDAECRRRNISVISKTAMLSDSKGTGKAGDVKGKPQDTVRIISFSVEPSRQQSSRFDDLVNGATRSIGNRRNLSISESIPESCRSSAPSLIRNAKLDHIIDIDVGLAHTFVPIETHEPPKRIPCVRRPGLHKARSEEILRNKPLATPVFRRSLPLSIAEKMDQDQFLEDCKKTGNYFVETAAYRLLKKQLLIDDVRGMTLLGSPGDGKSATARYMAWILHRDYGYLPLKVTTVSEMERLCIEGQKIVFVVEDPLGKLCTSSELKEHWFAAFGRFQDGLGTSHVKIIATVRTNIWIECKYSLVRFPPFTSSLNISDRLTQSERYNMLCKHLSQMGISPEDSDWVDTIHQITHRGTNVGFPQCCQLMRTSEFFKENAAKLFMNPLFMIQKDLRRLRKDDPSSFSVLALTVIHGGKLLTTVLDRPVDKLPSSERDKIEDIWRISCRDSKLVIPTSERFLESADCLCSSYLNKTQTYYEFSLTSQAEAVFIELGLISPNIILKYCQGDWICRLVRAEDCEVKHKDRNYLVLAAPSYHKFASVLMDELLKGNAKVVLNNPSWGSVDFLTVWKSVLTSSTVDKLLAIRDVYSQLGLLSRLAATGHLSLLKIIADPTVWEGDIRCVRNQYGQTLLHSAAAGNQLTTVLYLLENGLGPDVVDDGGDVPLHLAILRGNTDVVRTLLKHGANPDQLSKLHGTPAQVAALCGNSETMSVLLPRLSDQDGRFSAKTILEHLGGSELHQAARECDVIKIHHLLDNGFNKNEPNKLGWTPVYMSAMLGHTEAVSLLLTRGANPNLTSNLGLSPLDEANMAVDDSIISLLLSYGSKRTSFV